MTKQIESLSKTAIELLKQLIETPSLSGEEYETASIIAEFLSASDVVFERHQNNIWASNKYFSNDKPTLLLNSHHDTVKPNKAYTIDPFKAVEEDGKLFGLGSNDAGGCLVSLITTFVHFYHKQDLNYNLVLAATAEEETSGPNGLKGMLDILPDIDLAIVGEPTQMQMAVAEKGLVVFDAKVKGTPGHAAHPNANNALYNCIPVLQWFKDYRFLKTSEVLGEVNMTVSQINGGRQHNAVPAEVDLVVDVRVNDRYSNQNIVDILKAEAPCETTARGTSLNSSSIPLDHKLVRAGKSMGLSHYGSPTLSDQACLSCPSLKIGPGDSTRSHSANEFIYLQEIHEGIDTYIKLLEYIL